MPQRSAFTWPGAQGFYGGPTHIEQFYRLLPALWGTEIDFTEVGSDDELKLYAWSVVLGSALYEAEKAGNQANPLKASDLIPLLEQDFGIIPGAKDSLQDRQNAIAVAELFPRGCIPSNVVNASKLIVAAMNFLAYVPSPEAPNPTRFPTWPISVGVVPGQFKDVRVLPRFLQLIDPVATTGERWVAYENLDTTITTPTLILNGETVVVQAGNTSTMERVTVDNVATPAAVPSGCTPGYNYFQADFQRSHDIGAPIVTGNYPYWWSTQRLSYIVVSATAAVNRQLRAKLDVLLGKILRTVDMWAIVQATTITATGGTVGPLVVGGGMGTQSVGSVTFKNSM
jgi:hypothetical protein